MKIIKCRILEAAFTDFDMLESPEQVQFFLWAFASFRLIELAHHHYMLGNIPDSFWDGQVAHLSAMKEVPALQRFWKARRRVFSSEFQELVDNLQNTYGIPVGPELIKIIRNKNST